MSWRDNWRIADTEYSDCCPVPKGVKIVAGKNQGTREVGYLYGFVYGCVGRNMR